MVSWGRGNLRVADEQIICDRILPSNFYDIIELMDETPIQPPQPQPPTPARSSLKFSLIILAVIGLAIAGYFASAYYFTLWPFEVSAEPIPIFTPRSSKVQAPVINGDVPEVWETFLSTEHNFKISYPPEFTIVPHRTPTFFDNTLGLNQSIFYVEAVPTAYDSRWGITIFDSFQNSTDAVEKIIASIGAQWNRDNSRSEQRMPVTIGNLPAILITVRTSNDKNWISRTVIIQHKKRIYSLSDGAYEDSEFNQFYSSFRILN